MNQGWLKCDFHIHTKFSDGELTLPEIIDLYGRHQFDVIAITDHLFDSRTIEGLIARRVVKKSLDERKLPAYFEAVESARRYAKSRYNLTVIPGLEICFGFRYHMIALDPKGIIRCSDVDGDPKKTIKKLRAIGCELLVACHPHSKHSKYRAGAIIKRAVHEHYLWKRRKEISPLIDAWEIANRYDLFNVVGLEFFPFIANSDLHKSEDIYSWKTLVQAEPTISSIKDAIKSGRVALTLFRRSRS